MILWRLDYEPRAKACAGDVWYDTGTGVIRVWDGLDWASVTDRDLLADARQSDWDRHFRFWHIQRVDLTIIFVISLCIFLF